MGKIYKALGILERGHLVETDSSGLIAGYLGKTALKTKDLIREAMGGVLFIDEAYSLTDGRHPDFGKKAVATLLKIMEDQRGGFSVIVAGYTQPMKEFIQSNPGLKSRFDNTFQFPDFTPDELMIIGMNILKANNLTPDKEAYSHIETYLNTLFSERNQFFGNARSVRKMVDQIIRNQHIRMASMASSKRKKSDIESVILEDVVEFTMESVQSAGGIGFKFGNR